MTKDVNEVIKEIAEAISTWEGKDIARIANKVLDKNVTYIGDSFFETQE